MLVLIGAAIAATAVAVTAGALAFSGGTDDTPSRPAGSGTGGPTAAGLPRGPSIKPGPAATLTSANGAKVTVSAGTRCWAGACVDYIGPVTNVQPIVLAPGERLQIAFEPGTPREQTARWVPVSGEAPHPGPDGIAWSMPPGGSDVDPASLAAPALAGRYLLVSFAWWAGGDAGHAWYVDVR